MTNLTYFFFFWGNNFLLFIIRYVVELMRSVWLLWRPILFRTAAHTVEWIIFLFQMRFSLFFQVFYLPLKVDGRKENKFFDEIRALLIVCVEKKKMRSCGTLPSSRLLKSKQDFFILFLHTAGRDVNVERHFRFLRRKKKDVGLTAFLSFSLSTDSNNF